MYQFVLLYIFKRFYLFIFGERGMEGEEEKHQYVVASYTPSTGILSCNPGVCPDWESDWQPFGLQVGTQSTEPHQPGHLICSFKINVFKNMHVYIYIIFKVHVPKFAFHSYPLISTYVPVILKFVGYIRVQNQQRIIVRNQCNQRYEYVNQWSLGPTQCQQESPV